MMQRLLLTSSSRRIKKYPACSDNRHLDFFLRDYHSQYQNQSHRTFVASAALDDIPIAISSFNVAVDTASTQLPPRQQQQNMRKSVRNENQREINHSTYRNQSFLFHHRRKINDDNMMNKALFSSLATNSIKNSNANKNNEEKNDEKSDDGLRMVLPNRHSRKELPSICFDQDELEMMTNETLNTELGALFSYPSTGDVTNMKRQIQRKMRMSSSRSSKVDNGSKKDDKNIDYDEDIQSEYAMAWDIADLTIQKVEYLIRGYSYQIPGSMWNELATKKNSQQRQDEENNDNLQYSLKCIENMEKLIDRLYDEGHFYMQLRKKVGVQLAREEISDILNRNKHIIDKQRQYHRQQKSLSNYLKRNESQIVGAGGFDEDDMIQDFILKSQLVDKKTIAKVLDDDTDRNDEISNSINNDESDDISSFLQNYTGPISTDDDHSGKQSQMMEEFKHFFNDDSEIDNSNIIDDHNVTTKKKGFSLDELHPRCLQHIQDTIKRIHHENSDQIKKRVDDHMKILTKTMDDYKYEVDDKVTAEDKFIELYHQTIHNADEYYSDPKNVVKALEQMNNYDIEKFNELYQHHHRNRMEEFALPGPTVSMYDTLLDSVAALGSVSKSKEPEDIFGIFNQILYRHKLDFGISSSIHNIGNKEEQKRNDNDKGNMNPHTLPTAASMNASLRCIATIPYENNSEDNDELRDEALMVAFHVYDAFYSKANLTYDHYIPIEKNSATIYYMLQIVNKFIPKHSYRIRFNVSYGLFVEAKKMGILETNILKELFKIFENNYDNNSNSDSNDDNNTSRSTEYETFLKKYNFSCDETGESIMKNKIENGFWKQEFPQKWRKNSKIRAYNMYNAY